MTNAAPQRVVREIPATKPDAVDRLRSSAEQLRVVAYCRVSTQQEEQLNSYETQVRHYTEAINAEPNWRFAGIYADKGISGTSVKKRDEFNRMIRACKRGTVDLILTKSISRFARNTVDCLKYVRLLRDLNVDVYFEEQGIHSNQPGAEFYITIYGCIAQSESENISANVRFGKNRSAKDGNVSFAYASFLGYRKGEDGKPEIVESEAEIVRRIYAQYLQGDSLKGIAKQLTDDGIRTPCGKTHWEPGTVRSILSNERYKGDAILGKTYIEDCISKKIRVNAGERPKYYIQNSHPAIIDAETFGRVQEELARRSSKMEGKKVGDKTLQRKYSGKYAMSDLLICGECGSAYRRCTWTAKGEKRIVWRCMNRLEYGKQNCKRSPTLDENSLQAAVMDAITERVKNDPELLQTLQTEIEKGLTANTPTQANLQDITNRITEIDRKFADLLRTVSIGNDSAHDAELEALMTEKNDLRQHLQAMEQGSAQHEKRKEDLTAILPVLRNRPLPYDDALVRQTVKGIIADSKTKIRVVFPDGETVEQLI